MRKFFYAVVVVVVGLFGLTFSTRNHQRVDINYYFGLQGEVALPLLLLGVFGVGMLVGWALGLGKVFKARRELRKVRRELRAMKQGPEVVREVPGSGREVAIGGVVTRA